nr:hypothetical protein [Rhodoferax sp.]
MCGDVEDEGFEGDLYQRFLMHSQAMLARRPTAGDDLNSYLDQLFTEMLNRCVQDAQAVPSLQAYRRVAMQSLVLARLAGFLAGHVALNEDPLRKLMEALMLGYGEADIPVHGQGLGHDHGHDHVAA